MRHHAEMIEGQEAWERFKRAVKTVLAVPKNAVVPDRGKAKPKKKATQVRDSRGQV